jgi:hypothetical protein
LIIHSTGMSHKFGPICGHVREANFYEKALFVKSPTWRPLCGERDCSALRAMLLSALSVNPRSSVALCIMRSVFSS